MFYPALKELFRITRKEETRIQSGINIIKIGRRTKRNQNFPKFDLKL